MTASWKHLFEDVFKETHDNFDDLEITLSESELNKKFDTGFGAVKGKSFLAWSENWVYFPVCYDGAEWIEYVPRNPNPTLNYIPTHYGGG